MAIENEKFCTKCGKKFVAVGREVICPACKESTREEAKKAAVLKAKRASWSGESVPVRISGRASTVIREYASASNMHFASALDDLLKSTDYFKSTGTAWQDVEPYKSRRMKKSTDGVQEVKQDKPVKSPAKPVKQAARVAGKTTSTKSASKAVKKEVKKA